MACVSRSYSSSGMGLPMPPSYYDPFYAPRPEPFADCGDIKRLEGRIETVRNSAVAAYNAASKAQETANYARGLQKDLDERTRNMEKRLTALDERVTALEPKPKEPTAAELVDKFSKELDSLIDGFQKYSRFSTEYYLGNWMKGRLEQISKALNTVNRF